MPRLLKKSWLDSYLDYVGNSEIPTNYNEWVGISLIASTLKRNVFLWFQQTQYYPNQYIVLIGPPGIGKGRAMRPGITVAKEAATVNFIEDRITPEKLIAKLAEGQLRTKLIPGSNLGSLVKDCSGCVIATELAAFLAGSEWMHTLLCDLWDRKDYNYDTKNKGNYKIDDLCFSLLAGCTPDYIRSLIREKMSHITGGFTARTIFVFASSKHQLIADAFGAPNGTKIKLYDELVEDLKTISTLQGEVTLSDEAKEYWKQIYSKHNTQGSFDSDAYANFKSRISSHILKTATAISVSATDSLIIEKDHLERATRLVEAVGAGVDIVFKYTGESPITVSQERIEEFIHAKGMCSRTEIMRYNRRHVTDEQLTIILRSLEISEVIRETTNKKGRIVYEWVG